MGRLEDGYWEVEVAGGTRPESRSRRIDVDWAERGFVVGGTESDMVGLGVRELEEGGR